jgi:L-methionine (R)-S-oxide reductase
MPKEDAYRQLIEQARRLLEGEPDLVANTANLAALLYHALPDVNWVGFYFHKDGQLVLGPFQGKTACVRIPLGKGVCGTAAQRRETVVVENVHEFPGHIACDAASNSEIVVPLIHEEELIGVLDIDSPQLSRFDDDDRAGLEAIAAVLRTAGAACDDLRNRLA